MSRVDAIVFDLGGVIVAHDDRKLVERLASRCASAALLAPIGHLVADPDWRTGARPITALHEQLRRDGGYDLGWPEFTRDWCSHLALDSSMLALVERLARTHRVLLFSNTDAVHWAHNLRLSEGRLGAFEAYLSHELGLLKPAVAAFEAAARRAGLDPARTLFFDDVAANVEGARAAGFQAEVFETEARLVASLAGRGITIPRAA